MYLFICRGDGDYVLGIIGHGNSHYTIPDMTEDITHWNSSEKNKQTNSKSHVAVIMGF